MQISRKIFAAFVCVGVLGSAVTGGGPAYAFDPEKVFEEEKPSAGKIIRFFFKAWKKGDNEDAIGALKYAADQGDHGAQWKLGQMYASGQGVQKSDAEAFHLYKQIADGYANAQPGTADWAFTANAMVALGKYYLTGIPEAGIAVDPYEARVMFTTAATYFGHSEAQFQLARMHLDGADIDVNVIQAARMLKKASSQGHPGAEALLGQLLFEGRYLRRDPVRGLQMMLNAQKRASGKDAAWIAAMQEEAFALASEEERRAAIALVQQAKAQ